MADYSINPQFANLTGLQPLQSIDVTRGGSLQFQPLQQIQVVSSQPELVAQGVANAIQGIGQGALSGITAKWQKEEDLAKEQRKYKHELDVATIKSASEKEKEDLLLKRQKDLIDYKNRVKNVLPSGFFQNNDETPIERNLPVNNLDLPEVDQTTGENISPDLTSYSDINLIPDQASIQDQISKKVSEQVKALEELSPEYLTASTDGIGPIAPTEKPSLTLQGVEPIVSPEMGQEIAQTRLGLRKTLEETKKATPEVLQAGIYPITSKAQSDALLRSPLAENVKSANLVRNPSTNQYAYVVEQMTPAEIAEKQRQKEESESRISSRQELEKSKSEALDQKKEANVVKHYQDFIKIAQNEPSIKYFEDPKIGVAKFFEKVPDLYSEYDKLMKLSDAAYAKGDSKSVATYRRQVVPLINSMFDEVIRLESGKATTEGQTKLFKDASDMRQKFQTKTDAFLKGGNVLPKEQIDGLLKTTLLSGNQAAEKSNFLILELRNKLKEEGIPESKLPKFYPTDIVLSKDIISTHDDLEYEYNKKKEELDQLKKEKAPESEYETDVLEKQLDLLKFRIKNLDRRIQEQKDKSKSGKGVDAIIGFKELSNRPSGLRTLYGGAMSYPQQQQLTQPQY
jgi:hypothetical protein